MKIQKILALVFGILWGICELLNMTPGVESNSVLQLIFSVIKTLYQLFHNQNGSV